MLRKSVLASALAVSGVFAMMPIASAATIGFNGSFATGDWTTTLNGDPAGGGAPAGVDTSGAPSSIKVTGGDGVCSTGPCTTDFTIVMPSGYDNVSFHWDYTTNDADGSFFDVWGYLINGAFTQLSVDHFAGPETQSGDVALSGLAGTTFGFRMNCGDCFGGEAFAVVSQFEAPEPASFALLGLGLAGLFAARRRFA